VAQAAWLDRVRRHQETKMKAFWKVTSRHHRLAAIF
jgi:hypothetical protein